MALTMSRMIKMMRVHSIDPISNVVLYVTFIYRFGLLMKRFTCKWQTSSNIADCI